MNDNDPFYSNPEIPEGINTSKEHPLKDFFILTGGVLGGIFLVVFILSLAAEKLAVYIPFSMERRIANRMEMGGDKPGAFENAMQKRAENLAKIMALPDNMTITVHFVDDETKNAFATLGGNIYIHRGLLDLVPNDNALTLVLAHEMAHIKYRHPVIATGRGVVIGLFLAAVTGFNGDDVINKIIGVTGTVTLLGFSRDQERQADRAALAAVDVYYGHINGALGLFTNLLAEERKQHLKPLPFLSTHPLSEERIDLLRHYAEVQGWKKTGEITPLPEFR